MPNRVSTARNGSDQRDDKAFGVDAASLVHRRRKEGALCVSVLTMGVATSGGNARVLQPVSGKAGIGGAK